MAGAYQQRRLSQIRTNMTNTTREWSTQDYVEFAKMLIPPWYFNKVFENTNISDAQLIEIRGYRTAIAVGPALLDLSADQATFLRYPAAGVAYVLQSSDADDDVGDTGAEYVKIDFLNAAGIADSVVVAMNGVGQVAALAADQARAINGMKVIQAGATRTNEGVITLTNAAVTAELCRIPVGTGHSHACRYHVPVGKNLLVSRFLMECGASVGDGQGFDLVGTIYDPDTLAPSAPGCLRDLGPWGLLEGQKWEHIFEEVQIIPASTATVISEVAAWVTGDAAATDAAAASIFGLLVDV